MQGFIEVRTVYYDGINKKYEENKESTFVNPAHILYYSKDETGRTTFFLNGERVYGTVVPSERPPSLTPSTDGILRTGAF